MHKARKVVYLRQVNHSLPQDARVHYPVNKPHAHQPPTPSKPGRAEGSHEKTNQLITQSPDPSGPNSVPKPTVVPDTPGSTHPHPKARMQY